MFLPPPGDSKQSSCQIKPPTSLKIAKTTRGFQSYLSSERSTRSSTILKLINYSTSKTHPPPSHPPSLRLPPAVHSFTCSLRLIIRKRYYGKRIRQETGEISGYFCQLLFFLPSSFPQTSNIKALFDASSDSLYIRDVSQSPGLRAAI